MAFTEQQLAQAIIQLTHETSDEQLKKMNIDIQYLGQGTYDVTFWEMDTLRDIADPSRNSEF